MTGNYCENLCFSSGSREGSKADSIGHNIIVLRDRGSLFSSKLYCKLGADGCGIEEE